MLPRALQSYPVQRCIPCFLARHHAPNLSIEWVDLWLCTNAWVFTPACELPAFYQTPRSKFALLLIFIGHHAPMHNLPALCYIYTVVCGACKIGHKCAKFAHRGAWCLENRLGLRVRYRPKLLSLWWPKRHKPCHAMACRGVWCLAKRAGAGGGRAGKI